MSPADALPSIQLAYRPDLHILTGRWLSAEATLPEYWQEYAAIMAYARQHGTGRWLLDVRRRPTPPPGAGEWLAAEGLPQAAGAVAPARLRVAYLVSPQRLQAVAASQGLTQAVAHMEVSPAYDMRMFGDEGEAVRWLLAPPY